MSGEKGRCNLEVTGKYMDIEGTVYCWEGLLDNAIIALKEQGLSWTAGMIEKHLPELKAVYLKNKQQSPNEVKQ